jgi:starch synthase
VKEFATTVQRALKTYRDKEAWQTLQKNGMSQDFSWTKSALKYFELYQRLIATRI